ncbi:hypothetical protein GALL_439230 [mine drainage metagenome]|uniref:Uncharacterized protein n=1 Tax=mine drainage metagenome TaxID=410659 RepID=A0A1J5Q3G0_9ZZZZ
MDCHLVTVEVCVEGSTDERVNLDGLAFNQLWFESLDTEAVQGWCTVEHYRVFGNYFLEHIPNDRTRTLDHSLSRLDVLRLVEVHEALHDERLEQFKSHLLRQTTLVELQLRANDNY